MEKLFCLHRYGLLAPKCVFLFGLFMKTWIWAGPPYEPMRRVGGSNPIQNDPTTPGSKFPGMQRIGGTQPWEREALKKNEEEKRFQRDRSQVGLIHDKYFEAEPADENDPGSFYKNGFQEAMDSVGVKTYLNSLGGIQPEFGPSQVLRKSIRFEPRSIEMGQEFKGPDSERVRLINSDGFFVPRKQATFLWQKGELGEVNFPDPHVIYRVYPNEKDSGEGDWKHPYQAIRAEPIGTAYELSGLKASNIRFIAQQVFTENLKAEVKPIEEYLKQSNISLRSYIETIDDSLTVTNMLNQDDVQKLYKERAEALKKIQVNSDIEVNLSKLMGLEVGETLYERQIFYLLSLGRSEYEIKQDPLLFLICSPLANTPRPKKQLADYFAVAASNPRAICEKEVMLKRIKHRELEAKMEIQEIDNKLKPYFQNAEDNNESVALLTFNINRLADQYNKILSKAGSEEKEKQGAGYRLYEKASGYYAAIMVLDNHLGLLRKVANKTQESANTMKQILDDRSRQIMDKLNKDLQILEKEGVKRIDAVNNAN
jgi:hypothetical protein